MHERLSMVIGESMERGNLRVGKGRGLSIGDVARRAKVSVETIRFYEREGILPPPPRTRSGHRRYPREAVEWVCLLRRARSFGFSVQRAGELLQQRLQGDVPCDEAHAAIASRASELDRAAGALRSTALALRALLRACRGDEPAVACPVLTEISRCSQVP